MAGYRKLEAMAMARESRLAEAAAGGPMYCALSLRARCLHALPLVAIASLSLWVRGAAAEGTSLPVQPITAAVVDLDYADTSGEATDQRQVHQVRVKSFAKTLTRDLTATGKYHFVSLDCGPEPCTARTNPFDLQKAARAAGARLVLIGGFHKMSTLVQWAKIQILDANQGRVVFDRLVTFRNDSDEAWSRAEIFLVREIEAASLPSLLPVAMQPPKLAVFGFELEDFSAGGGVIGESEDDAKQLKLATEAARRLIAQSGRYRLVDVSHANAVQVEKHTLRNCNGCEAAIAAKLGADQSLLGIVTRISRTEYAVAFKRRNAQTGTLISTEQTGLRIGANYSWDRGAAWLVEHRLLQPSGR
jgi:hypothetical protein